MQAINSQSQRNGGSEQRSGVPPPAPDPKVMQQQAVGKHLQQTQAQVNEVVDMMRVNVDKVLERDQKLAELDQRADLLVSNAARFEASAQKLKDKLAKRSILCRLEAGASKLKKKIFKANDTAVRDPLTDGDINVDDANPRTAGTLSDLAKQVEELKATMSYGETARTETLEELIDKTTDLGDLDTHSYRKNSRELKRRLQSRERQMERERKNKEILLRYSPSHRVVDSAQAADLVPTRTDGDLETTKFRTTLFTIMVVIAAVCILANQVWIAIVAVGSLCLSLNAAELPRPPISRQLEMYRHRTNILYNQLETENCATPEGIVVKRSILSDRVATHLEFEKVFYQKLINQLIACRKQKLDLAASTTTSKPGSTTASTSTAGTTERTIPPTTKLTSTPTTTTTTTTAKLETTTQTSTTTPSPPATDCQALWYRGVRTDGVYTLTPEGFKALDAWCQFDAKNGWTVIQKRYDGTIDFYRTWSEYKSGFGELGGEYWLGNEKIFSLTRKNRKLSIYLMRWDGDEATANYSNFYISNESDNYRLTISGYSGNVGYDGMADSTGYRFSTHDRVNDAWGGQCADLYKGAWWYNRCTHSNLNGLYTNSSTGYITNMWLDGDWSGGYSRPLRKTSMMLTRDWPDYMIPDIQ